MSTVSAKQYNTVLDRMLDACPQTAELFENEVREDSNNFMQETNRVLRRQLYQMDEDTRHARLALDDTASFPAWWSGVESVLSESLLP